jgi:hypothetical protein
MYIIFGPIIELLLKVKNQNPVIMKKQIIKFIFLSVLLQSCSHYYYVPSVQNVPLFKGEKEYRLSGAISGGEESVCTEVQAAYSVTKNIGIMSDFMSAKGGEISDNEDWAKGNYIDGAIGYYKPINKYGVFEIYAGLGESSQHQHYMNPFYRNGTFSRSFGGTSDLSFTKIFVQPSFGLTCNGFDIALSTRISILSFNGIVNQISGNSDEYNLLNNITNENHLLFEPAITIRGGWKYVKLQFQAATASCLFNPDLRFENYHIGIGLYIAFAKRHLKDIPKNNEL